MKEESFFIVMSQSRGPSSAPYRYNDLASATEEARRLAGRSPGDRFYVMQALRVVETQTVLITDLAEDIPF